jgi:GNAT superfamily N-acetyltransferase
MPAPPITTDPARRLTFSPVSLDDFDELVALRIAAMRESLERVGRFDPTRARERLRKTFVPAHTFIFSLDEQRIGFYAFRPEPGTFYLDHLYVHPVAQRQGIGSFVMSRLITQASANQMPIRVGALRNSASNRFYQRHGFAPEREDEWDIYYVRPFPLEGETGRPAPNPS